MNILGIKLGGAGKVDKDRPYKGYSLCYGSMSLSDCISAGFIPLSIKGVASASITGGYTGGGTAAIDRINIKVDGIDTDTSLVINHPQSSAHYGSSIFGLYFDLDSFYKGDLDQCKAVKVITCMTSANVVKWLEPISSGGGV